MRITSPEIVDTGLIPKRFTCMGEDISPTLIFEDVPESAVSLCLILDDPDAPGGTFTHWIVYNLPPTLEKLAEAVSFNNNGDTDTIKEGINDFGRKEYGGPCPPRGAGEHRYFFHLYALNSMLDLPGEATRKMVIERIRKSVLTEATLMGRFSRD